MFGFRLIHKAEEQAKAKELEVAQEQIARLEKELEYYRGKYDEALERADRQLDGLLLQNGVAPVTETTRRDERKKADKEQEELEEHQKELGEIFSEAMNTNYDNEGLELTPELAEAASTFMSEVRNKKA